MIVYRLIYPILYFPGYEVKENKMFQNEGINKIFLIIMILILLAALIGGIKNYKERIAQLCLSIIGINFIVHGIIGYNLINANIMTIHFSFAIIILLAYLAKKLNEKQYKKFNIFLSIAIVTVIISNIFGFIEIFKLGIAMYPK